MWTDYWTGVRLSSSPPNKHYMNSSSLFMSNQPQPNNIILSICIYVNDVKQSFIKNCSILNFRLYATANSNSALFSFGVRYPNTAIGMLFDLFKYAFPCLIKSSKL